MSVETKILHISARTWKSFCFGPRRSPKRTRDFKARIRQRAHAETSLARKKKKKISKACALTYLLSFFSGGDLMSHPVQTTSPELIFPPGAERRSGSQGAGAGCRCGGAWGVRACVRPSVRPCECVQGSVSVC